MKIPKKSQFFLKSRDQKYWKILSRKIPGSQDLANPVPKNPGIEILDPVRACWHTRLTHPPDIYVGYIPDLYPPALPIVLKSQFCNLSMFLNCPVCAIRDLKCDVVLDMATLTGAQVAKCHTLNISNSIINREYRMAAIMPVHYLTLRAGRQLWLVLKPVTYFLFPSPDVQGAFLTAPLGARIAWSGFWTLP